MSDYDLDRIIKFHLSPINVSFQTMNPKLRCKMLHNRFAGDALAKVDRLYKGDVTMNGQIVLCKGINDRDELEYSLEKLSEYAPVLQKMCIRDRYKALPAVLLQQWHLPLCHRLQAAQVSLLPLFQADASYQHHSPAEGIRHICPPQEAVSYTHLDVYKRQPFGARLMIRPTVSGCISHSLMSSAILPTACTPLLEQSLTRMAVCMLGRTPLLICSIPASLSTTIYG